MRVVIVEDETAAAVNLVSLLRQTFPRMEVVAQLESVTDTVEWFSENEAPELVFMDIHLADGSAFSVFEKAEITCPVVFTTAYDQYALDAFRVNSIDYLLKPIKESDLRRAVEKLEHLTRAGMGEYSRRIGELVRSQRGAQAFLVYVQGPHHTAQDGGYRLPLFQQRKGRGVYAERRTFPFRPDVGRGHGAVARGGFFPGQPAVRHFARGDSGYFGVVRQPAFGEPFGGGSREGGHQQGEGAGVQTVDIRYPLRYRREAVAVRNVFCCRRGGAA